MSSYREGLSRAIMEAMSSGLPCIVSDIRGNVDLIKDGKGGFLCKCDDDEGFCQAINTLHQDEHLRGKMGDFNIEYVKKFDTENVQMSLKLLYSEVCKVCI